MVVKIILSVTIETKNVERRNTHFSQKYSSKILLIQITTFSYYNELLSLETFLKCDIVKQCLRKAWSNLQEKSQGLQTNLVVFLQSVFMCAFTEGLFLNNFPQFGHTKNPFLFFTTPGKYSISENKMYY